MPAIDEGLGMPSRQRKERLEDWRRTGIGDGLQGGEIYARRGSAGGLELTNDLATPTASASSTPMPQGGMRRDVPAIGANMPDDLPLAQRGSIDNLGNGLGTFSQMQPGDSRLAIERFGRANEIRAQALQNERRGGGLTIVPDSTRSPTFADRQRARLEERQANTELTRQRTQQSIISGMDERLTGQLGRQRLQQQIQAGDADIKRQQRLYGILAGLDDPSLQGLARTQAERQYLMQADPKAFIAASANGEGLKLTEQQSKDLGYYTRGNEANAQLAVQGDALIGRATGERGLLRGLSDTIIRGTPWVGDSSLANSLVSTERQRAEQAGREVLAAILRKDTGAAITQQEMEIYGRMYLPQAGDSEEVLNQKAEARTRALESIRGGLGTAERKAAPLKDGRRQTGETTAGRPVPIETDSDYEALPSGALFVAPDGTTRRKP